MRTAQVSECRRSNESVKMQSPPAEALLDHALSSIDAADFAALYAARKDTAAVDTLLHAWFDDAYPAPRVYTMCRALLPQGAASDDALASVVAQSYGRYTLRLPKDRYPLKQKSSKDEDEDEDGDEDTGNVKRQLSAIKYDARETAAVLGACGLVLVQNTNGYVKVYALKTSKPPPEFIREIERRKFKVPMRESGGGILLDSSVDDDASGSQRVVYYVSCRNYGTQTSAEVGSHVVGNVSVVYRTWSLKILYVQNGALYVDNDGDEEPRTIVPSDVVAVETTRDFIAVLMANGHVKFFDEDMTFSETFEPRSPLKVNRIVPNRESFILTTTGAAMFIADREKYNESSDFYLEYLPLAMLLEENANSENSGDNDEDDNDSNYDFHQTETSSEGFLVPAPGKTSAVTMAPARWRSI